MKYAERTMRILAISDVIVEPMQGWAVFDHISKRIQAVDGDFRQYEILARWRAVVNKKLSYQIIHFTIDVASGTYIRSIANAMGGTLFTLRRTRIGSWKEEQP